MGEDNGSIGRRYALKRVAGAGAVGAAAWAAPAVKGMAVVPRTADAVSGGTEPVECAPAINRPLSFDPDANTWSGIPIAYRVSGTRQVGVSVPPGHFTPGKEFVTVLQTEGVQNPPEAIVNPRYGQPIPAGLTLTAVSVTGLAIAAQSPLPFDGPEPFEIGAAGTVDITSTIITFTATWVASADAPASINVYPGSILAPVPDQPTPLDQVIATLQRCDAP